MSYGKLLAVVVGEPEGASVYGARRSTAKTEEKLAVAWGSKVLYHRTLSTEENILRYPVSTSYYPDGKIKMSQKCKKCVPARIRASVFTDCELATT